MTDGRPIYRPLSGRVHLSVLAVSVSATVFDQNDL